MEIISKTPIMEWNYVIIIICVVLLLIFRIWTCFHDICEETYTTRQRVICIAVALIILSLLFGICILTRTLTDRYEYRARINDPTAFAEILKEYDNVKLKDGICTFEDRCE